MSKDECCVPGCEPFSLPLHKFPNPKTNKVYYRAWLNAIQNRKLLYTDPEEVYKNKRVCHLHFEDKYKLVGYYQLHRCAVPSLHLPPKMNKKYDGIEFIAEFYWLKEKMKRKHGENVKNSNT